MAAILRWGEEDPAELAQFRAEVHAAFEGRALRAPDPFASGGAIPLKAMRLLAGVAARTVFPIADVGYRVRLGVSWLPMTEWRSPGWCSTLSKEGTASPNLRFAGGSTGDGVTSTARTEVSWTMEGVRQRWPCRDAAGGSEPVLTARDRVPATPPGDPDFIGVEAAHATGGVVVFHDGGVFREKPGRESISAPGAAIHQAVDTFEERPEDTRPRGGCQDRSGVR